MGLDIGSIVGAATNLQAGFGGNSSLKDFITSMDSLGVQINSRYEATFSAIPQTTFYIQSINLPGMRQNITELHYDGKLVQIPQNCEYEHDMTMTVINDASGYIYSALMNFVMGDSGSFLTNSGYTMSIKAIGDDNHPGTQIIVNGIRIQSIGGLSFSHQGGEVQTFDVQCSIIDFTTTPGVASEVGGVVGAVASLLR